MITLVVSGALANKPGNAGEAWVRMSWVTGLRRMGFDVWFLEQIAGDLLADGQGESKGLESSPHVSYFRDVTRGFGLEGRSALINEKGGLIVGPDPSELEELAREAALLVNISGHLAVPSLLRRFRRKAYVDLDPGFTQFWQSNGIGARLAGHDRYFSVGLKVGTPTCLVPADGIAWIPVPPPVLLEDWPVSHGDPETLSTVASWRGSFGPIEHEGKTYGLKVHEFRKFIDLPSHVPQALEIALDIHPADNRDLEDLRERGWRILDPQEVVPEPDDYRRYIQSSGGEFSVAQGMYVETGSGWFSDRTVRYLASGKPALIQDTGFSSMLPSDEGIVAFRTMDEAVAGARRISIDYQAHCLAARQIAEEYFESERVLSRFLDEADVAA
ncbi:MAG: glycosyltransferase [Gammaproteobacteria bacterium]